MTLRATLTIPITTTHDFLFGAEPVTRAELMVDFFGQDSPDWCWAACAMMGGHYYKTNDCQQSDVVAARHLALANGSPSANDGSVEEALDAVEVSRSWRHVGVTTTMLSGEIPWLDIKKEIDAMRIVQIGWRWAGGAGAHLVLVVGYEEHRDGAQWVYVHDPQRTSGGDRLRYSELQAAKGHGVWTSTWLT
jgi:hypothetical protein